MRFDNYPVREPWLLEPARRVAARPRVMRLHDAEVEDTFAEAFPMWGARIVVTAGHARLGRARRALADRLRDVGDRLQVRGRDRARARRGRRRPTGARASPRCCSPPTRRASAKRLVERVGQTVLTCPTTACFNGLDAEDEVDVGGQLRFFGDGWQASKVLDGRRYWRIPVMEGEFLVEERFGIVEGVGGGNIIILAEDVATALRRGGGGGRRDAGRRGRDHAVPGRDRAQRQQGRLALQGR